MAKIRGFLQGAKGKIGDFVVQKGEMGTILRANNGVSNPQSAAQMAQRVAFATATNAAKKMLSVIGLSFYGVSNGKLSRRKFVSLNAPILKAAADAAIAGEDEWYSPTCHYKGKDVNQLVPNPYIVSDGSLVLPEQLNVIKQGETSLVTTGGEELKMTIRKEAQTIEGWKLLESLFGCTSGDQITLVTIQGKKGDAVPYEYEQGENVTVNGVPMLNYDWMRFTRMLAPRIVFKRDNLASLEVLADDTMGTLQPKLTAALRGCIDLEKSNEAFVKFFLTNSLQLDDNDAAGFDAYFSSEELPSFSEDWTNLAAGIVRSANIDGVWDFTRCQLVVAMDLDTAGGPSGNDNYSGLHIGNAIYTYVGVADAANKNFMTTGTPFDEMPRQ
jgi:hypothetical protein